MLKKAAALFCVCASMATWLGCGTTNSNYLYAAIPGSNEIVVFREDPNSGVLTQLVGSPIVAGQAVQTLVLHPSGKFLYAANSGESDVSVYAISSAGALTEMPPRIATGTAPTLLAMDPAGAYLYVANSGSFNVSVFSIDPGTGKLTAVGSPFPIGMEPINMALSPTGGFLYITGQVQQSGIIEAFSLSQGIPCTSSSCLLPLTNTGNSPYGLAIAPGGGFLYTANTLDNSISEFTINPDGSLLEFAGSPFGEQYSAPIALLINPAGTYMYVANQGSTNLSAYTVGSNGALNLLATSPFGTGPNPTTLSSDPGGKYLFVGNQKSSVIQSFSLDTGSGALTSVSTYSVPGTPTSIVIKH